MFSCILLVTCGKCIPGTYMDRELWCVTPLWGWGVRAWVVILYLVTLGLVPPQAPSWTLFSFLDTVMYAPGQVNCYWWGPGLLQLMRPILSSVHCGWRSTSSGRKFLVLREAGEALVSNDSTLAFHYRLWVGFQFLPPSFFASAPYKELRRTGQNRYFTVRSHQTEIPSWPLTFGNLDNERIKENANVMINTIRFVLLWISISPCSTQGEHFCYGNWRVSIIWQTYFHTNLPSFP